MTSIRHCSRGSWVFAGMFTVSLPVLLRIKVVTMSETFLFSTWAGLAQGMCLKYILCWEEKHHYTHLAEEN